MVMDFPKRQLHPIDEEDIRQSPEKFFMLDRCGFFICTEGAASLSFFNKSYVVRPGTLALFHPFVKIVFKDISKDLKGFWSEGDLTNALPVINKVLSVENIEAIKSEPVVYIKSDDFKKLIQKVDEYSSDCDELERELATYEICRPICRALLKSLNEAMMLRVLNLYYISKSKSVQSTTGHDIVFQKFMMDLQANYADHHDTLFYARRSSLSPKYFSTVVKNVSGAAPLEWIIRTIISVAQNYLTDSSLTIKEIASALGFSSQAFFCKYFKRYTSFSPKEYRMNHRI